MPWKSGKCEVRNNNIFQRDSEIKEATIFMKLIYNFISAKQLLVCRNHLRFFFLRVFNKVRLRNGPRQVGKSGKIRKVFDGSGKWNTLKFHVAGFPVNRKIYNTRTFLHPKIYKLLSAVGLYALRLPPIHAVLVIITGWHKHPHFTLLQTPRPQASFPSPSPTHYYLARHWCIVVLGMQWTWFAENQRSEKRPT